MPVFLAFKCLLTILDNCEGFVPVNLCVATDAQVVLSRLLSQNMAGKNIFAKNRLKYILHINLELESRYSLKTLFKYVETTHNPADLITLRRFRSNFEFWCSGPSWLREGISQWPEQDQLCLSAICQQMARTSANCSIIHELEYSSVVPFQRFSSFSCLLTVTALVFKFITIRLNRQCNYNSKAAIYLLRTVQPQEFSAEIEYLKKPVRRPMPGIVRALDLFLGPDGLIRSSGRIDQFSHLTYEVKNPILIGKHHPVTRLIMLDCHERCCHLGAGSTLAELTRSGYWVLQGRQFWLLVPDVNVIIQHQWLLPRRLRDLETSV